MNPSLLQRLPPGIPDVPRPLYGETHCPNCGVPLDPTDHLWVCRTPQHDSGVLVCFGCHEEASRTE